MSHFIGRSVDNMTKLRAKEKDGETTPQAILEAAERVFSARGFSGTSVSEIAAEAGVTKSLIHHHFGSKEELWKRIKDLRYAEYATSQKQIYAVPSDARLYARQTFETYFRFLQENPRMLRLLWWIQAESGGASSQQHMPAVVNELLDEGVKRVRELQARGEFRLDIEPRFVFAMFASLVRHWFALREIYPLAKIGETQAELDDKYLNSVIEVFLDGMMVASPPKT